MCTPIHHYYLPNGQKTLVPVTVSDIQTAVWMKGEMHSIFSHWARRAYRKFETKAWLSPNPQHHPLSSIMTGISSIVSKYTTLIHARILIFLSGGPKRNSTTCDGQQFCYCSHKLHITWHTISLYILYQNMNFKINKTKNEEIWAAWTLQVQKSNVVDTRLVKYGWHVLCMAYSLDKRASGAQF